jgi:predicted metal-dependent enzyme (double-stranded beta helix superfamily)
MDYYSAGKVSTRRLRLETRNAPSSFIQSAHTVCATLAHTEARMKKIKLLLENLVNDPTMREHSKTWPSTEGHKNLLLYQDPDYDFVVNAVVCSPGRDGRVHDHRHAWTAYGVFDGTEKLERYRRLDDGKKSDYALVQLESSCEGKPDKVDLVQPFAIHSEKGGPERSVALIVRSERLVGRVLQGRYDIKTGKYHRSKCPTQVLVEVA